MRFLLELLRIIFMVPIIGGLIVSLLNYVYAALGFDLSHNEYDWLIWIAILLLFFVLYRNKLQFSGWYKGNGKEKLPTSITFVMIGCSVILFIITPFLG